MHSYLVIWDVVEDLQAKLLEDVLKTRYINYCRKVFSFLGAAVEQVDMLIVCEENIVIIDFEDRVLIIGFILLELSHSENLD